MKKVILLTAVLFISIISFGQNQPEDITRNFFIEYSKNPTNAVDNIYATNKWMSRAKDAIDNLKKNVQGYTEDFIGKYYGYEIITKKQLSESFVLISYLVKYERQPLRFTFELYKPNDKWILFSFNIDSDIDDEVEQAAKIYNLNLDKK